MRKSISQEFKDSVLDFFIQNKQPVELGAIAKALKIKQSSTEYNRLKCCLEKMDRDGLILVERFKSNPCQHCAGKRTYVLKEDNYGNL